MKNNQINLKTNNSHYNLKLIQEYMNTIDYMKLNIAYNNTNLFTPKVSIIATVFNKDNYLNRFIKSVQSQILKEFELILVDDFSTDNSVKTIKNYQKNDNRIKLIQNKKNRGTLFSRAKGLLHSKGEYIIWIDPDDILLQTGLFNAYNHIKKYNLSIVQFNAIIQINDNISLKFNDYIYLNIIKQPFLSYIFYYNETTKKGAQFNTALWDKLIDRKVANKAIYFIGKNFLNKIIKIENDVVLLFSLFRNADSYQFINDIGYFYVRSNKDSISNNWKNPENCQLIIHSIFSNIMFIYTKSSETHLDKLFCIFKLQQSFKRYKICFEKAQREYKFIEKTLKLLQNSSFISKKDKKIIENIGSSISFLLSKK